MSAKYSVMSLNTFYIAFIVFRRVELQNIQLNQRNIATNFTDTTSQDVTWSCVQPKKKIKTYKQIRKSSEGPPFDH